MAPPCPIRAIRGYKLVRNYDETCTSTRSICRAIPRSNERQTRPANRPRYHEARHDGDGETEHEWRICLVLPARPVTSMGRDGSARHDDLDPTSWHTDDGASISRRLPCDRR